MSLKDRAHAMRNRPVVAQRFVSAKARRSLADEGKALPDGSFPIETHGDLDSAAHLYKSGHQGTNPMATAAHIRRRAKALGVSGDPLAIEPPVAQSPFPSGWSPDGVMWLTAPNGEKRYVPYTLTPPVAQDGDPTSDAPGTGVITNTPSSAESKVGQTNPEQPQMPRKCPKCGYSGPKAICPTCGTKTMRARVIRQDANTALYPANESSGGGAMVLLHCEHCGHEWTGDNDGDADDVCPSCGMAYDYAPEDDSLNYTPIVQINEMKRIVTGVVQSPDTPTRPGSLRNIELVYPKDTIAQMAWDFLAKQRNNAYGVMHNELQGGRVVPQSDLAETVESYIAPCDLTINGRPIAQGSWIVSARIKDDNLWSRVLAGEIQAFSLVSTNHEMENVGYVQ